ncbi:MAG TPA: CPBP family intramembrane glutamic endopeptidase, partial [Stellaceae bacterium]|nr:CPBP family intramembrane glutamic endopeptidase [Stellaceae bacterium]
GAGRGWAFIDLAALGRNTAWNYAATVLAVVAAPIAFLAIAFAAIFLATARRLLTDDAASVVVLAAAFVSVIVAGVVLAWRVARGHRRPWMSLISPDLRLDWRRLAIGAGVEGALLLIFLGFARVLSGRPVAPGPGMGLPALALIMLLVPFQAASEEMLFRGYLTQALGRVLRRRGIIAAIVGIVFAALHFDAYGALTMPYLFGLSVLYSIVSLRDERLELTIGAHAATNWFGVSMSDALDIGRGGEQLSWAAVALLVVNGVLFYVATRLLVRLCAADRPR